MRRYWWVYISVALIIVSISVLTCRNERLYHEEVLKKQKEQAVRDSIIAQIAMDVDAVKISMVQIAEHVEEFEEKIDTIQTIQEKQLKKDNKQVRELRQIRRVINKCRKKSEK